MNCTNACLPKPFCLLLLCPFSCSTRTNPGISETKQKKSLFMFQCICWGLRSLPAFNKDGWPTVLLADVVSCCRLKMQVQEMLQRSGPAVSRYTVIWDVDSGLGMCFLSVGFTTVAWLSYSMHKQRGGGLKTNLREVLPGNNLTVLSHLQGLKSAP